MQAQKKIFSTTGKEKVSMYCNSMFVYHVLNWLCSTLWDPMAWDPVVCRPQPWIEPVKPAVEVWSLNCWTARGIVPTTILDLTEGGNVGCCVCMLNHCSPVWLFATLWTVARQAPLSMGSFRQEYWGGLPLPSPGIFFTQGSNPGPLRPLLSPVASRATSAPGGPRATLWTASFKEQSFTWQL